jgi:hypothetical protein
MKDILRRQNSTEISRQVSPDSLLYVFTNNCQRALVDESGMIINQFGTKKIRNGSGASVTLRAHPIDVTK